MKRATFIIPKADNNGQPFPAKVVLELQRELLERFEGYTFRHASGAWVENGTTYYDESWEYTIVMEEGKLGELVDWLRKAKDLLSQQAMWLEIQEVDAQEV